MEISEALRKANGGAIYRPWGSGREKLIVKPGSKSRYALMDCAVQYPHEGVINMHPAWSPLHDDLTADDWELLEEGDQITG